jgi:quinoprotein glucose dehydrogenase
MPTKPPPFDRQGVTDADLIDFTPDLHRGAQAFVDKYVHGPLFTPPSERGTINLPGWGGGANWAGGAFDPDTGLLYVPSVTSAIVSTVTNTPPFASDARYVGSPMPLMTMPNGLPPFKPPYGRITAIDLKTGNLQWTIPMGEGPRRNPLLAGLKLPPLGWDRRGWVLATRTLLFVGQEPGLVKRATEAIQGHHLNVDVDVAADAPALRVLDKRTGRQLWQVSLPDNETGAQMTYELHGRQYIVVPTGGLGQPAKLVALAVQ